MSFVWTSLFLSIHPLTQAWQKDPKTVSWALDALGSTALILMRVSQHYGRSSNLLSSSEVVQLFYFKIHRVLNWRKVIPNLTLRRLQQRWVLHPKDIPDTSETSNVSIKLYIATSGDDERHICTPSPEHQISLNVSCLVSELFSVFSSWLT